MEEDKIQIAQNEVLHWMKEALGEAQKAFDTDQVPVGCIFVRWTGQKYEKLIGSHNLTNLYQNASRHCEINCINQLQKILKPQQISECILFVTVEPCIMCTHALNLMGIKLVYFGQYNDKFGGCGSLRKDHKFKIEGGIMEKQSFELIRNFYERGNQRIPQELRNKNRKKVKIEGK